MRAKVTAIAEKLTNLVEITFVKVQKRPNGSFVLTIPSEAVRLLEMVENTKAKVFVDLTKKRIVYQLQREVT